MNLDGLFVNRLLTSSQEEVRSALRLIPTDTVQGLEREVYRFIRSYYKDFKGELPSRSAVSKKYPEFELLKAPDTLQFYAGELRERQEYEILTTSVTTIQNNLYAKDIGTAKEELRKLRVDLANIAIVETDTAARGFVDRKRAYVKAKKNKGIIGIQTRIDAIDKHIGGIQDEYYVIVARRGTGKTFLSLMFLKNMWPQLEGPVAFVSNEMGRDKILGRLDSVVGEFSYSKYRKGLLNKEEERRLVGLSEIYKRQHELYVISGAGKSADEIEYELVAIEPTVVFVDGLYLTDMGFNDPWKDTLAASRAYQRMSKKYNIPVIATTQLSDDNQTKYARAVEEDADIVMKMYQSTAMRDDKVMGLTFLKIREEDSNLKAWLKWDFDAWDFSEADYETADVSAEKEFENQ